MLTHAHSIDEPPRRVAIQNWKTPSVPIGIAFGTSLTTAEQLFLQRPWTYYKQERLWHHWEFDNDCVAWRQFFE